MTNNGTQTVLNRYSAKKTIKPINFVCYAPDAASVSISGDFNDWSPVANPLKRQPDGGWVGQVPLSHGPHHYLFVIDGKLTIDQRAQGIVRNEKNEKVSLVTVS